MKIRSGTNEVFWSGTVIGFEDKPIEFVLLEGPPSFVVRFIFKDDPKREQITEGTPKGEQELDIVFYNFNNPLGTGNPKPLTMGTISGRPLMLYYRVYALGKLKEKLFHYTWYLGEEVQGG